MNTLHMFFCSHKIVGLFCLLLSILTIPNGLAMTGNAAVGVMGRTKDVREWGRYQDASFHPESWFLSNFLIHPLCGTQSSAPPVEKHCLRPSPSCVSMLWFSFAYLTIILFTHWVYMYRYIICYVHNNLYVHVCNCYNCINVYVFWMCSMYADVCFLLSYSFIHSFEQRGVKTVDVSSDLE